MRWQEEVGVCLLQVRVEVQNSQWDVSVMWVVGVAVTVTSGCMR